MKETREEKTKRLYDQAKKETADDYLKDMLAECIDAGLIEVEIDEETGEERYKPTPFGLSIANRNMETENE